MSDEWGPWIEHDGQGCPCVGKWVQAMFDRKPISVVHGTLCGKTWEGIASGKTNWTWIPGHIRILRYRIRKPRGLLILEQIARDVEVTMPEVLPV